MLFSRRWWWVELQASSSSRGLNSGPTSLGLRAGFQIQLRDGFHARSSPRTQAGSPDQDSPQLRVGSAAASSSLDSFSVYHINFFFNCSLPMIDTNHLSTRSPNYLSAVHCLLVIFPSVRSHRLRVSKFACQYLAYYLLSHSFKARCWSTIICLSIFGVQPFTYSSLPSVRSHTLWGP